MENNMSNETEQQKVWTVEDEIEASIKPCPKCGGKAVIEKFDEVVCLECGLWSGDEWESLEYAVDWWNKQPLIDDLHERIAALEAEIKKWKVARNALQAENERLRKKGCYPMRPPQTGVLNTLIETANAPGEDEAWAHLQDESESDDD